MTHLLAFFAWARGLAIIAKIFAIASPFAALIPGGSLVSGALSAGGSVLAGLWTVVKWVFQGIQDVIAHPAALSVCLLCGLGGAYSGVKYTTERVIVAEAATARTLATLKETKRQLDVALEENGGWRRRYDEEQQRAAAAEAARDAAIRQALEASKPAQPVATRRLRPGASATPKPAAGKASDAGVFSLPTLQWPFK